MEHSHQQQVAENVYHASYRHKEQGRLAVPQSTENSGKHVVGYDEENAAAANAHIGRRLGYGCFRCLHQHGNRPCKAYHDDEQHSGNDGEHNGGTANDPTDLLGTLFPKVPGNEHRHAHGQLGNHESHQIQHLTAGGYGGQAFRCTKVPHHQQVYRTVGSLQNQCAQNGQHKGNQLLQNVTLSKVRFRMIQR